MDRLIIENLPRVTILGIRDLNPRIVTFGKSINRVEISEQKCHFGGCRYWFKCPNCCKNSYYLYAVEENLKCRKCFKYFYKRQTESKRRRVFDFMFDMDKIAELFKRKIIYNNKLTRYGLSLDRMINKNIKYSKILLKSIQ